VNLADLRASRFLNLQLAVNSVKIGGVDLGLKFAKLHYLSKRQQFEAILLLRGLGSRRIKICYSRISGQNKQSIMV